MLLLEGKSGNTSQKETLALSQCGQRSQILQFRCSYWKSLFRIIALTAIAQCWVTWYQQDFFSSNRLLNIMKTVSSRQVMAFSNSLTQREPRAKKGLWSSICPRAISANREVCLLSCPSGGHRLTLHCPWEAALAALQCSSSCVDCSTAGCKRKCWLL